MSKVYEFEIRKENLVVQDFQNILDRLVEGAEHVLICTKVKSLESPEQVFRGLLDQMISRSEKMIFIGSKCFEKMVEGISDDRFYFIQKTSFDGKSIEATDLEGLLIGMTTEFLRHHLPTSQSLGFEPGFSYVQACVRISGEEIEFDYQVSMSEEGLRMIAEKVLLIPLEGQFLNEYKDLAAELLNLMCGHLRAKIRKLGIRATVGIPRLVECVLRPDQVIQYWKYQQGLELLEVSLSKEVKHVSP